MMIIRIGDERRSLIEDHLRKLRDMFCSDETLKHHRQLAVESLVSAATNLPHKAFIYGALYAMIAQTAESSLVSDVALRALETLQTHLVEEKNVHASKNLLRFISIAFDYGVIQAKLFSQTLIQLLDECQTSAGGKLKGASDQDLVLETIMAGLPISVSHFIIT
jgi:hypothetical protein